MVLKIQLIPFQMGLEFSGPTIWAVTFQLLLPIPAYPQKYRGCVCFTIIEPHPTGHRSQHLLCLSSFSCQPLNVRTIFGTRFGLLEDCWERHETNTNYFGNFRWLHNLHKTRKTNMALEKWMVGRQLTCLLGPGTFSGRYQEGTLYNSMYFHTFAYIR